MSVVFNSPDQFASRNSRSPKRAAQRRPNPLRTIAGWLGLFTNRSAADTVVTAPVHKDWKLEQDAMLAAGERMLQRARRDNQLLSIAVFDLSDLPELESVFGARLTQGVVGKIAGRLQEMATAKGLAMRTDATVFTVLMPGFGRDRALLAIQKTMGHPCCIELDAGDNEIVLVPEFKVHTLRSDSGSLGQVYSDLCRSISQAKKNEQRRRKYLQQERESHTRPMALRAQGESSDPAHGHPVFRNVAPTIPMPLSGR